MRARDYQPGDRIPGTVYSVIRPIGGGGMGTVYDVEDTTIGKRYVLKTLHRQLGAREDLARRIQNEARTLARLNHPNIVEVITAGVTADDLRLPYYVMERLNGQSLRIVLEKKGRLELPHAYHIGIDLLDALDHAHDKGVIHRDVKPDNIFLHRTVAGVTVTKLLDFGIMSMLDGVHTETAGRFLGTLRYAAPEQLRGERPTPKMDVYAAGLVLYEMVAGRGPFDDEGDGHRVAAAHVHKYPPPASRFVAIPKELDALLMAALAKDPAGRPRDAFSFAASLRNLKRVTPGVLPDSTENRSTASALIGSYPTPTSLPATTMRGMASATAGTTATTAGPSLAGTTVSGVDGHAATGSFAPDTMPSPQAGTEVTSLSHREPPTTTGTTRSLPSSEPPGSIEWPDDGRLSPSEGAQVRSLPVERPRRSLVSLAAGVFAVGMLFAVGTLVASVRSSGARAAPGSLVEGNARSGPSHPVVEVPAPTIAPPQLDDPSEFEPTTAEPLDVAGLGSAPSAPPASSTGLPAASAAPPGSARPRAKAAPSDAGHQAAGHVAPDRPGPGF